MPPVDARAACRCPSIRGVRTQLSSPLWFIDSGSVTFIDRPINGRYLSRGDLIEIADELAAGETSSVPSLRARVTKRRAISPPFALRSASGPTHCPASLTVLPATPSGRQIRPDQLHQISDSPTAVSYTHLTLPTSDLV